MSLHPLDRSSALTDDELLASYPWPESRRWVRGMMVMTLDGAAAGADGLSESISSDADQQVFRTVRRHADAILIGARTMRSEEYTPMRAKPADAVARAAAGQAPAPVIVVVSHSLDLPWELPVWSESAERPIVITSGDAGADRLAQAREHADVIVAETTSGSILDAIEARGLRRIVCEGGPSLLRELTASGDVDELDLTLSPLMSGTGRTPETGIIPDPTRFALQHVLESDGFLMTRYVRETA